MSESRVGKGRRLKAIREKKEEDNDLFELLGSYKYSEKRNFDYEEIIQQMDEASKVMIDKTIKDRMNSNANKPNINLEDVSNNTIDWRRGGFYSIRYVQGCFVLFVFSFLSFVTGIIYFEFDFEEMYYNYAHVSPEFYNNDFGLQEIVNERRKGIAKYLANYQLVRDAALIIMLFLSLMTVFTFITMHSEYIEWKKSIKQLPQDDTFVKTKGFKTFLVHCFLLVIQPYIFLRDHTLTLQINGQNRETRVNYFFLTLFLPIRFWYIIKYFIVSSYFYSPRAQRLCSMYQSQVNINFAIKCILKAYPLISLIVLFGSNIFLGGYLIRIWERPGAILPHEGLESIENCAWYAFITMSTVGYGDFFAKGLFSRILAGIVGICGVFINATVTVILTDNFTFQGGELKAFSMLNQIELREELGNVVKKLYARCLMINHCKFSKVKFAGQPKMVKKIEEIKINLMREKENIMKSILELKEAIKSSSNVDPIEIVMDKLSDVRKSVKMVKDKINAFESVMETGKENQRNLEALKNTILAIDEKEE